MLDYVSDPTVMRIVERISVREALPPFGVEQQGEIVAEPFSVCKQFV